MIIKTLKLVNYRRFARLELEFPENFIGIIGPNGAGKSTIMEAMGWALYGTRISRTEKQDIRSQFAAGGDVCQAEMEFVFGGHEYRVVRKLKGKKANSEASIFRDAREQAEAVQERGVNEYIESLLHLDYRSFFASVFARQKELAALSSMQPEDRRKSINRLINIDEIDRARERVRRDRNEKQSFLNGLKSTLKNLDELKRLLRDIEQQKKQADAVVHEMESSVNGQADSVRRAEKSFDVLSRMRDQFVSWQAQIDSLKSRLQESDSSMSRLDEQLKEIKLAEKELKKIEPKLLEFDVVKNEKERLDVEATRRIRLDGLLKEKSHLQKSLDKERQNAEGFRVRAKALASLQKEKEQMETMLMELEATINEMREKAKNIHGQRLAAERAGKDVREKLERIQQLGPDGQCPVCTQTLGSHYQQVIDDFEGQLQKLRQEYATARENEKLANVQLKDKEREHHDLMKKKEKLNRELGLAEEAGRSLERCQEAMDNFLQQLKIVEKEIEGIGEVDYHEKYHEEIKGKFQKLSSLKERAVQLQERIRRRATVEGQIAQLRGEQNALKEDILQAQKSKEALDFDEQRYLAAKQEVEEQRRVLDKLKEKLGEIREDRVRLENEVKRMKAELKEEKRKRLNIKKSEEEIAYLSALDFHFGQFRTELAGRIRPLIAHRASELLALTTGARYSMLELDEDYNIKIYDGNRAFPISRFSGGEQDLANLCLRIAISQVVAERSGGAPINFIILDEIFGSQDENRRGLILNALTQLSSQFRQIFVITHVESMKDIFPVLINVSIKDDRRSEATLL